MNKLLLNGEEILDDIVISTNTDLIIDLNDTCKKINIIVEKDNYLNVIDTSLNTNLNIMIVLNENASLRYNKASINTSDVIEVDLNGEHSNCVMNNSIINDKDTELKIITRHNNKFAESKLVNHGVNKSDGKLVFKVDSIISNSADFSVTKQENKIINLKNGISDIFPNLIVDNDNVDAAHSAYISDFDSDILFYMNSRGLNNKEARRLLIEGFLIGNLDIEDGYIDKINTILK